MCWPRKCAALRFQHTRLIDEAHDAGTDPSDASSLDDKYLAEMVGIKSWRVQMANKPVGPLGGAKSEPWVG